MHLPSQFLRGGTASPITAIAVQTVRQGTAVLLLAAGLAAHPASASTTVRFDQTHSDFDANLVDEWIVPYTTLYTITAIGGRGGDSMAVDGFTRTYGGYGAGIVGTFNLTAGTALDIVVGGAGYGLPPGERILHAPFYGAGGGGASSVVNRSLDPSNQFAALLLVAAGGGGAGGGLPTTTYANGGDGRIVETGYSFGQGAAGRNGGGGGAGVGKLAYDIFGNFYPDESSGGGGGGAGWQTDGKSGYANGGDGGHGFHGGGRTIYGGGSGEAGGIGGGGGGGHFGEGGGGGGWSGGAGGDREKYDCDIFGGGCRLGGLPGGGGGSANNGIFQFGIAGYRLDQSHVFVTYDAPIVIDTGGGGHNVNPPPISAVPEPASWAMLLAGLGLTAAARRRCERRCLAA